MLKNSSKSSQNTLKNSSKCSQKALKNFSKGFSKGSQNALRNLSKISQKFSQNALRNLSKNYKKCTMKLRRFTKRLTKDLRKRQTKIYIEALKAIKVIRLERNRGEGV